MTSRNTVLSIDESSQAYQLPGPNASREETLEPHRENFGRVLPSETNSDTVPGIYDHLGHSPSDSRPKGPKRQRREKRPELKRSRFGNNWLHPFQSQRNTRNYGQQGEPCDDPIQEEQDMVEIRQVLSIYSPKDQFSFGQASLLWKQTPIQSLSTQQSSGKEREKAMLSALFCCNADGSEKLDPWFIGTTQHPRAFRAAGIHIDNFNLVWRSNPKACITSERFAELIYWFDSKMAGRKVVLLLDNISVRHGMVRRILLDGNPLQNTLIIWFPPNQYQHLGQGIVNSWKVHWKQRWIQYILCELEANRNPISTMNVAKAIHWGLQSWNYSVSVETIQNCFRKALSSGEKYQEPVNRAVLDSIRASFSKLQKVVPGQDLMSITTFLYPIEETVENKLEDIDHQILSQYMPEPEEDSEEELEILPKVSTEEAIAAMQKLRLYEEQQSEGNSTFIRELNRHENVLWRRKLA